MITKYKFFESKQVGILYHFTNLISLYYILKFNTLETNRTVDDNDNLMKSYNLQNKLDWCYISFTRNKNFHKTSQSTMDHPISCRLTIDGDKLSHKYRIYPVNYFDYPNEEDEECVIVKYNFKDIKDYMLKTEIPTLKVFQWEIIEGQREDQYSYKLESISVDMGLEDEYEIFKELQINHEMIDDEDIIDIEVNLHRKKFNSFTKKLYKAITNKIKYDNYL